MADDVGLAAQQFDPLLLAQAEFAQAVAHFRRGGQFLDANGSAGGDVAQRTDCGPGTPPFNNPTLRLVVFHNANSISYPAR